MIYLNISSKNISSKTGRYFILSQQPVNNQDIPENENEKPPSRVKKLLNILLKDFIRIYKTYPKSSKIVLAALIFLVILIQFKPLLFLLIFILIDRAFVFLETKTEFTLGLEHVSIVSILFGYYYNVTYGFLATLFMMIMLQYRNNKLTFLGFVIDGVIWFAFVFLVAAMKSLSIGTIAFILPIGRFLIKEAINITLGFQVHDLHKDSMNMIYQIFFIHYLGPMIGFMMLG